MISDTIKNNGAYKYAKSCENNNKVGKYVKKQCEEFIKIADGEYDQYYIDSDEVKRIENILTHINIMPKKNAYENLVGFQWFFIINSLCVRRYPSTKRRYELSILLIARKNGR